MLGNHQIHKFSKLSAGQWVATRSHVSILLGCYNVLAEVNHLLCMRFARQHQVFKYFWFRNAHSRIFYVNSSVIKIPRTLGICKASVLDCMILNNLNNRRAGCVKWLIKRSPTKPSHISCNVRFMNRKSDIRSIKRFSPKTYSLYRNHCTVSNTYSPATPVLSHKRAVPTMHKSIECN